ncbi:MAG TPA: hypothetical protein VM687_03635 [Stenotrophomonas sp.]|nr:hypothetical protein [Stenotrophomonas sp.]
MIVYKSKADRGVILEYMRKPARAQRSVVELPRKIEIAEGDVMRHDRVLRSGVPFSARFQSPATLLPVVSAAETASRYGRSMTSSHVDPDLVFAWQAGHSIARGSSPPVHDRGGIRVDTGSESEVKLGVPAPMRWLA